MASEALLEKVEDIVQFWLERGAAGFRLDAAKHIFEDDRSKNVEFWRWFGDMCRQYREDVFLIGEVWSGDNELLAYYESGLTAFFHFAISGSGGHITGAVNQGNGGILANEITGFIEKMKERNPNGVYAPFLSNHDSNRSAGYIIRPERMKMQAAIYLLLPGAPFIYYGEEIAMEGSGVDENKRKPMEWDKVERDLEDPDSLLNYYRKILEIRGKYPDIQNGDISKINTSGRVCAYYIGRVAVLHNLGRDPVEINISELRPGMILSEALSTSGELPVSENGILTMPSLSTAILR
jgi:alpha-amylase